MTAIVYLDIDDEITSAATRLRLLDEDRIALVLPHGSRLATSRINFRLLAREAAARHKTLEIVTGDASARALAASAGLPTHVSVAAFEAGPTVASMPDAEGPRRRMPVDDSPTIVAPVGPAIAAPRAAAPVPKVGNRPATRITGRQLAAVLGVVAVLAAGAVVGFRQLPSASIRLVPAVDRVGPIKLTVTAQSGITQPDPTHLLVPATTFTFDLAASNTFPATGIKVDETVAGGEVTFQNCDTSGSVTVPEGAQVSTDDGVRFTTLSGLTLKRAHVFPQDCPAGTVAVAAILPGPGGNLPAGAITKVPREFDPLILTVRNLAPTTGGTHTETRLIVQADVDTALTALTAELATMFDGKVSSAEGVPAGTTLFAETKVLGQPTPSVDPATLVGTTADTFELGLASKGTVVGADPGPVSTLADARIRSAVADGYSLVEDSIDIQVGAPVVSGSAITFPVIGKALAVRDLDVALLRRQIRGLGLPQARTVLEEYGAVTITVWPDWVTTIPEDDNRVSFTIAAPPDPGGSQPVDATAPTSPGSAP